MPEELTSYDQAHAEGWCCHDETGCVPRMTAHPAVSRVVSDCKRPFLWPKLSPEGRGRQSTQARAAVTAAEGTDAFQTNGHMTRVCIHVCDFKLKAVHTHTHTLETLLT